MLYVAEIFDSLQGEGPYLHPAVFLRTALCNLKCEGFNCTLSAPDGTIVKGCDTIRAVNPKFKQNWTLYSSKDELIKKLLCHIRSYSFSKIKQDIVVTGGEPLLHIKNPVLCGCLEHFISQGHKVIFETNASLNIDFPRDFFKECTFSMGVKLKSSGESFSKRVNLKTIDYLIENSKDSYLKFVVSKDSFDEDIKEIELIVNSLKNQAAVYLMPKGKDIRELEGNCRFVIEKCIEYGFFYTDRSHIRAWNTKEGV